jgi:hypothetical protein
MDLTMLCKNLLSAIEEFREADTDIAGLDAADDLFWRYHERREEAAKNIQEAIRRMAFPE